ncbi:MAG TPA: hypothetical protein VIX17_23275 [Pyrinomonadaceae bacterium]
MRKFVMLTVAAVALLMTLSVSDASAQGRGRGHGNGKWDNGRGNSHWKWGNKCDKFVNCHDARDGRWDNRGPRRRLSLRTRYGRRYENARMYRRNNNRRLYRNGFYVRNRQRYRQQH